MKNTKNDKKTSETQDLKIAVIGKSLVGKSALTYRFTKDAFPTQHDTTIEDQYRMNLNIEGVECMLEILDTAGQDDYQSMLDSWINFADGFLLVYAINDLESFENLRSKYERILRIKQGQKVSIMMVGNKCDLVNERKVNEDTASNLSKEWSVKFIEASALNKINVKETFLTIAKEMLIKKGAINVSNKDEGKGKKNCYCV